MCSTRFSRETEVMGCVSLHVIQSWPVPRSAQWVGTVGSQNLLPLAAPTEIEVVTWTDEVLAGERLTVSCPFSTLIFEKTGKSLVQVTLCLSQSIKDVYYCNAERNIINNNSLHLFSAYYLSGSLLSTTMSFDLQKNSCDVGTIILSILHMGKPRLRKVSSTILMVSRGALTVTECFLQRRHRLKQSAWIISYSSQQTYLM